MRVVYSSRALAQLESMHEYLSSRSAGGAANVTSSIRRTIARLIDLPQLGKLTDEAHVRVVIEPEYLYRVFYTIDGKVVTVLRILHRSQG
jgi:plasmid stabilization system protein ParE